MEIRILIMICLTDEELKEIEDALHKAEHDGKLDVEKHSSFFLGFVGEKLMEKFLGIKFCDMSFDDDKSKYYGCDCKKLNIGIKTIRSTWDPYIYCNSSDILHKQFIANITYDYEIHNWRLVDVLLPQYIVRVSDEGCGKGREKYLIKKGISITKDNLNDILNCKYLIMAVYKNVLDSDRNPIIDFVTIE